MDLRYPSTLGYISETLYTLQSRDLAFVGQLILAFKPPRSKESDDTCCHLESDDSPHSGHIFLDLD